MRRPAGGVSRRSEVAGEVGFPPGARMAEVGSLAHDVISLARYAPATQRAGEQ